jgi:hypothetical protein
MMHGRSLAWSLLTLVLAWGPASYSRGADAKNDPTGTWVWSRELEGESNRSVLKLVNKDGKVTGTYRRSGQTVPISNGKFEKGELSFEADGKFNEQKIHAKFHGKLSQDEINGDIDVIIEDNSVPLPWTAKRGVDLDDVVGTWKLKIEANGDTIESTLKLTAAGEKLKGTYTGRLGEQPAQELKLQGNDLSWQIAVDRDGQKFKGVYKATLEGNSLKGNLAFELGDNKGTIDFTGERTAAKPSAGKNDGSSPKREEKSEKSSSASPRRPQPIVSLKGREEILTVHYAGVREVTFSIFSIKGERMANAITLETLQAKYPAVYRAYRASYADAWATKD